MHPLKTLFATAIFTLTAGAFAADGSDPSDPLVRAAQTGEKVSVAIDLWPVPWPSTRPRDPDVAPDGNVWFVGQTGDYVAQLNPKTEDFRRINLPPGTGPHNVIVDDEGILWVAGNRQGWIGRMLPTFEDLEKIEMPDEAAGDPHTLIDNGKGQIWFTVQGGNFIGRLDKESKEVELVKVPTENARPYGIRLDENGQPWIALFGTHKLATVDPETMKLTEIDLPREDARVRRLEIASNGDIWYLDYAKGYIGRYRPSDKSFKERRTPGEGRSGPYGTAIDDQDRVWFFETWQLPNRLLGFDTKTERFVSNTALTTGRDTVRHMVYDPKKNTIWFGTDSNWIGQAKITN